MSDELSGENQSEYQAEDESQKGNVGRVFLSMFVLALAAVTAVFAYLKDGEFVQELLTKDAWNTQMIGNLHPVLMLLPLGLIIMVLILEILGWFSFGSWKPATVAALFFVVITAVLASLSGLVLMNLEGNDGPDWTQYMWYGIGATVAFALSFICKIWGKDGNDRGFIYAVFLLAGAGALGYGGYIFGQKVHAFTLVPSKSELTTPFGNEVLKEEMSASISELKASNAQLDSNIVEKDTAISQITEARKAAEESYLAEQKKLAAADKKIGELMMAVQAEQKKAGEIQTLSDEANAKVKTLEEKAAAAQKQIQTAMEEKDKLQKQINDLQAQIEALSNTETDAPEAPPEDE